MYDNSHETQRTTSEPRVNDWLTDICLICNFELPGEEEDGVTHINSETVKDSAKCSGRERTAKDLGVQRN